MFILITMEMEKAYTSYKATILSSVCVCVFVCVDLDYVSLVWLDSTPHVRALLQSNYHPAWKGMWPCACGIIHCSICQCLNHQKTGIIIQWPLCINRRSHTSLVILPRYSRFLTVHAYVCETLLLTLWWCCLYCELWAN